MYCTYLLQYLRHLTIGGEVMLNTVCACVCARVSVYMRVCVCLRCICMGLRGLNQSHTIKNYKWTNKNDLRYNATIFVSSVWRIYLSINWLNSCVSSLSYCPVPNESPCKCGNQDCDDGFKKLEKSYFSIQKWVVCHIKWHTTHFNSKTPDGAQDDTVAFYTRPSPETFRGIFQCP